jgi:hypothetical protein
MTGQTKAVAAYPKRRNLSARSREEKPQAKAYALQCIAKLVDGGLARLDRTADGGSELRLVTGEVYRLGEKTLRRIG